MPFAQFRNVITVSHVPDLFSDGLHYSNFCGATTRARKWLFCGSISNDESLLLTNAA